MYDTMQRCKRCITTLYLYLKLYHMHSYQSAHAIILLSDLLPCHECMQGKELVHMIIIMYAHAYMNACMYDNYGGLCTSTATFGAPRMHLHTYIHTYIHVAID